MRCKDPGLSFARRSTMSFVHAVSIINAFTFAYLPNGDAFSLISLIVSGLTAASAFAIFFLGKDADKKKVTGTTLAILFIASSGVFMWLHFFNQPPPPPHAWSTMLQEFAPGCNAADGSKWKTDGDTSTVTCAASGLLMQRTNNQGGAEEDLDLINGSAYNQTQFRVQVDVQFQNTARDGSTMAELIVQTPPFATGGFTFGLNNTGYWALKSVATTAGQADQTVHDGSISFNVSQPVLLEVDVHDGLLTGYINGQQVVQYADALNPSSAVVGMVTEWLAQSSQTPVIFRDFRFDL